jgi:hypothetical protein
VVIVINNSAECIDVIKTYHSGSSYDYYHYGRFLTSIHSAEVYDYYHYERPLRSIHSTEVFMTTTTMEGL